MPCASEIGNLFPVTSVNAERNCQQGRGHSQQWQPTYTKVLQLLSPYTDESTGLGLLPGTEAPVMTPNGVDFSFLFFLSKHCLAALPEH